MTQLSRRWRWRCLGAAAMVALACAFPAIAAAADRPTTFRFNPPNGTTYVETMETTRKTDLGQLGHRLDQSKVVSRTTLTKARPGYRGREVALAWTLTRNGQRAPDPIASLMKDLTLTYDVSDNGQLLAVRGVNQFLKRVRQLGAATAQALAGVPSEEVLIRKIKAEWDGRVARFVGRKAKFGDLWIAADPYELPTGGTLTYFSAITLAGRAKRDGHECVKIEFKYNTDAAALGKLLGKTMAEVTAAAGISGTPANVAGATLAGSGWMLADPDTMLTYGQEFERRMTLPMDIPGRGRVMAKVVETKRYTYKYRK